MYSNICAKERKRSRFLGVRVETMSALGDCRHPPLAKKPQGTGHPKPELSSVKVRATRRTAESNSLRQRAGADEPAFSGVVRGTADRVGTHSARQADAERARREFPRTVARRVFDRELVSELVRCAAENRSLADRLQRRTSAQQFGIQNTEGVCGGAGSELLHS